jgi:hypothetical protein
LFVEKCLASWLPTLATARVRPENGWLDLVVADVDDFVAIVNAASGANIRCIVAARHDNSVDPTEPLLQCLLRLELEEGCIDPRLAFFLYEAFSISVLDSKTETGHKRKEWAEIKKWEHWLTDNARKSND